MFSKGLSEPSIASRIFLMLNGLEISIRHPWGIGSIELRHELVKLYPSISSDVTWIPFYKNMQQLYPNPGPGNVLFIAPHNQFIEWLLEGGFIGLIMFIVVLYALWHLSSHFSEEWRTSYASCYNNAYFARYG